MTIKNIIIDNEKTKARRLTSGKVQLDLNVLPVDDQNDVDLNARLRLYINWQLLESLNADLDWYIKTSLILSKIDGEYVTIRLEDEVSLVKSNIKCILLSDDNTELLKNAIKEKTKFSMIYLKNGLNLSNEKYKKYIDDEDMVMAAVKQNGYPYNLLQKIAKRIYLSVYKQSTKTSMQLSLYQKTLLIMNKY
jgi:hypothetical protein